MRGKIFFFVLKFVGEKTLGFFFFGFTKVAADDTVCWPDALERQLGRCPRSMLAGASSLRRCVAKGTYGCIVAMGQPIMHVVCYLEISICTRITTSYRSRCGTVRYCKPLCEFPHGPEYMSREAAQRTPRAPHRAASINL